MTSFRLRLVIILIVIIFLSFFYRGYRLTFYSPLPKNAQKSNLKQIRRGSIYDSAGNELAISKESASIGIRPVELLDVEKTAQIIAPIVNLTQKKIVNMIQKGFNKNFFWLRRKLDIKVAQDIRKLKIPGAHINIEPSRDYPNQKLASNLVGFVDIDNQGLGGIEFQYNDVLTTPSDEYMLGHDIYLSIHSFLQYQLEKALRQTMRDTKAKAAVGVISETNTGRILALSSLPDFNPQKIQDTIPEQRKNRAVNSIYEPGSTFKIFTLAALLENHLIKKHDRYFCPGYIKKKGFRIRCSGIHHEVNMAEVIQRSCNTGIIEAALKMPTGDYHKILKKFGFGSLTQVYLAGESRGILKPPNKWDTSIKMSIPIGHGVAVTPMQIIAAANSVANGGRLLKLHVIDKIVTSNGKLIFKAAPQERNRSMSVENSREVLNYLKAVVEKKGTGRLANLELSHVKTSGKTGTAIVSDKTGYFKDKYQASFLGFFPADQPKITMFILFDEPEPGAHSGGLIAAPVFRKVLRKTFSLIYTGKTREVKKMKEIDFDKKEAQFSPGRMPNLIGRSKKDALKILWKYYPGKHRIEGSGYVLEQRPAKNHLIKKPYQFIIRLGFPD